jgi:hypothetical protein
MKSAYHTDSVQLCGQETENSGPALFRANSNARRVSVGIGLGNRSGRGILFLYPSYIRCLHYQKLEAMDCELATTRLF